MKQSEKSSTLMARHQKKWDDKEADLKVVLDLKDSVRIGNIGTFLTLF